MVKLAIVERKEKGRNAGKLRQNKRIPAVFYGPEEDSTSISVDIADFSKVWKEAGESSVIILDGVGDEKEALIHDVSVDPVSEEPIHVDFYVFRKGEKLQVEVPLEFVGSSTAVKEQGAVLVKVMHEVEVEAEPRNLPHEIEVDLSSLKEFGDQLTISDIKVPEGVSVLAEQDDVVALVSEPKEEEEEEEPVEFDESMVEVEGEDKEGSEAESEEGETESNEEKSKEE